MPQSSPWANFPHVPSLVWRARRSVGRENVRSLQTDQFLLRVRGQLKTKNVGDICSRLYGGVRIIVCNIRTFTENIRRYLCKFYVRQSNFSGSKAKMCETHSFCVRVGVFVTLGRFPWPLPKSWILAGPIKLHNVTKCNIVIWQSLATSHHTEQWWHHVHLSVTGTWIPTTTTTCVRLYLVYMSHWVSSCTWVTCEIEWQWPETPKLLQVGGRCVSFMQPDQTFWPLTKRVEDVYHSCNLTRHFDHSLMDSHCGLLYNIYTVLTYNRANTNTCKIQRQEGQRHHHHSMLH